jgi:hypothetical protein
MSITRVFVSYLAFVVFWLVGWLVLISSPVFKSDAQSTARPLIMLIGDTMALPTLGEIDAAHPQWIDSSDVSSFKRRHRDVVAAYRGGNAGLAVRRAPGDVVTRLTRFASGITWGTYSYFALIVLAIGAVGALLLAHSATASPFRPWPRIVAPLVAAAVSVLLLPNVHDPVGDAMTRATLGTTVVTDITHWIDRFALGVAAVWALTAGLVVSGPGSTVRELQDKLRRLNGVLLGASACLAVVLLAVSGQLQLLATWINNVVATIDPASGGVTASASDPVVDAFSKLTSSLLVFRGLNNSLVLCVIYIPASLLLRAEIESFAIDSVGTNGNPKKFLQENELEVAPMAVAGRAVAIVTPLFTGAVASSLIGLLGGS